MDIIIGLVILLALTVSTSSVFVIRHAASRPANGELSTLMRLDKKLISNQQHIARSLTNCKLT